LLLHDMATPIALCALTRCSHRRAASANLVGIHVGVSL
jgi:hypothetical protein